MKLYFTFFILIVGVSIKIYPQHILNKISFTSSQFIAGSGFGTATELQLKVADYKNRNVSVGLFYDSKLKKIGGGSINIRWKFNSNLQSVKTVFNPYFFFNLIYHQTKIDQELKSENYRVAVGQYSSIEHYTGIGTKVYLFSNIYLIGELGGGIYFGSIMKPSKPDETHSESYGTNGISGFLKLGIGASLNR